MSELERPKIIVVTRTAILKDGEFLFIQRADSDSNDPGLWEFPGGKLDQGQDHFEAQERETREETGLDIELISPLVFADSEVLRRGKYTGHTYIALFSLVRAIGGSLRLSKEHQDGRWLPPEQGLQLELTASSRRALKNIGHLAMQTNRYKSLN